ncbi:MULTISPECIES: hypothetical protein [Pseudosulfitobacter]|uniref:hypothetical protein n=1 Tax=Pseudosulfitobacter pseudonitzschiae TaxID=1402135 RepID=UPI0011611629|nr:hypothetical protein [Pseudosulfitobacter pseudonitzschiae]QKS08706.1 hypothetical protein HT745_09565 [Pseudosulfitobacter pseudonitzschiae]
MAYLDELRAALIDLDAPPRPTVRKAQKPERRPLAPVEPKEPDDPDLLRIPIGQFYVLHDLVVARQEYECADPDHPRNEGQVRPAWPLEWRNSHGDGGLDRQLRRFWCVVLQQAILEACEEYLKRDHPPPWVGSRDPREVGNLAGLNGDAVAESLRGHFSTKAGVLELQAAIRGGASHEAQKAARDG